MKNILISMTIILSFFAMRGFSQETSSPVGSQTSVGVNAEAIFVQGDSTSIQQRQFTNAVPGTIGTPGPSPMFPQESGKWDMYRPATYRVLSMEEIKTMKRRFGIRDLLPGNWKNDRVRSTVIVKNAVPRNSDPIVLISWWPKAIRHGGDRVIAVVTVIGDFLQPEELYLGLGLEKAKDISGTRRVAIRVREIREGVTRGRSLGVGGGGGQVTADDASAVAYALGGMIGTNRVRSEDRIFFEILCLNDGPTVAPEPPVPAQK